MIMKNTLLAGFARLDITPPLGIGIAGYYVERKAEGILDPLECSALAVSDGDNTRVIISIDTCGGAGTKYYTAAREAAAESAGISSDGVFISSTHTHTGPYWGERDSEIEKRYTEFLIGRMADAACLAVKDMKPAKLGIGAGTAHNIAFIRRYVMKDGRIRTNPGVNNPDIVRPVGDVDESVGVLRFTRDDGPEIVLLNFGCHPDVVGGNLISADWPGFARRTVERSLDNVRCIFLNGAEGDVNHVNVHPKGGDLNGMFMDFDDVSRGYPHSRHMGNVVAAAALQAYEKVEWRDVSRVGGKIMTLTLPSNMPTKEQLVSAREIASLHRAGRDKDIPFEAMELTTVVAEAERMLRLENGPESFAMPLSSLFIGDTAFIGIPGEPFGGIGKALKQADGWAMVLPCCITNGYEGYFPMKDSYDEGGYEARSSIYAAGAAERIIEEGLKLLSEIRKDI